METEGSVSRRSFLHRYQVPLVLLGIVLAFTIYVAGVLKNPPGFYLDESSIAYNAYTIARYGVDEYGVIWPLYIRAFGEYKNPTYIYLLAVLYKLFGPSILVARLFSEVSGFVAALLLGYLAARISHQRSTGVIVALTALLTPWLFEISRLVFEVALFPLVLVLFLLTLHCLHNKERWSFLNCVALAVTLALITYTYSIGRLLGPMLAIGLLFFATRARWVGILQTWIAYALTLLPLLIFNHHHPGALSARFEALTYIKSDSSLSKIALEFTTHYLNNFSLVKLLLVGDPNIRHHIWNTGSMFVATIILIVIGLDRVLHQHWRDAWWRFVLYGLAVSVVPASLTNDEFHSLRLIPVPIFLLILTVPALAWLGESGKSKSVRRAVLAVLLGLTLLQAGLFQRRFHWYGPRRGVAFDAVYPEVFAAALATQMRPIYLKDREDIPGYIHAYWYGALHGINPSQFVRLSDEENAPAGALVISTEEDCSECEIIFKRDDYIVYRAL